MSCTACRRPLRGVVFSTERTQHITDQNAHYHNICTGCAWATPRSARLSWACAPKATAPRRC
eukprot:5882641-Pyramimonas_sp.AAC.1